MRLDELVGRSALGLTVRACPDALDRTIRWVHPSELLDPSRYLEGGELILTSGMWRRSARDSERFVASLARSGVAGVGYGLPTPATRRIPRDLVKACERHGLPLLEVPHELPFMAISEVVLAGIVGGRQEALRDTIRLNERLLRIARSGTGPAALLHALAGRSAGAWLIGRGGQLLAWLGERPTHARLRAATDAAASRDRYPSDLALADRPDASVFAVGLPRRPEAYLVWLRTISELPEADYAAIEQTLGFISLELTRQRSVWAKETEFARELIESVEAGEPLRSGTVECMRALRLPPDGALRFVVCATAHPDRLDPLVHALRDFFHSRGLAAVVPTVGGEAVALVADPRFEAHELARDLRNALVDALPDVSPAVGVGSVTHDGGALRRSLILARQACRVAQLEPGRQGAATVYDLAFHAALLALQEDDVRDAFRATVVGPLLRYDERHGTSLMATLDQFLRSNGKWQESADALAIHVNTLRQRLRRVEQVTGRRLSSFDDRVDLYLALRSAG